MSGASGWRRLTTWMPGLRLCTDYDCAYLAGDLTSGLVVALVVIPSAIAYADQAHCPPVAGLYAALGGMIAFALFTSSRHVVAGPDAAIAILVGAAVGPLSPVPPELSLTEVGPLLTGALGLALLIFPEGILLGRAMAGRHQYEIRPDQELLGSIEAAVGILMFG